MPNKQISSFDPPPHTLKTTFYTIICKILGCLWLLFFAKRVILSGRKRTSVTAENKGRQALRHKIPASRLVLSPQPSVSTASIGCFRYKTINAVKSKPPKLCDQSFTDPYKKHELKIKHLPLYEAFYITFLSCSRLVLWHYCWY